MRCPTRAAWAPRSSACGRAGASTARSARRSPRRCSPMQPDVAIVSPYPSAGERHGGFSGVASYSAQLAHALADRGAGVTVLAPREEREPDLAFDGPIRVERPYARGATALPVAARAALRPGAPTLH